MLGCRSLKSWSSIGNDLVLVLESMGCDKLSLNGVDREPSPAPQNFYQQTHPHGSCSEGNFPEASAQNVG